MALGFASGTGDNILNAFGNNTTWTAGASLYVQLHTGSPGSAGTTSAATPVAAHGAGTRQSLSFGSSSGGTMLNDVALTWSSVATSEAYSHFTIWDNATFGSGSFLGSGTVTGNNVTAGDTFTVAIGSLSVTLSIAA